MRLVTAFPMVLGLLSASACTEEDTLLLVDVKTDLIPGREFDAVRVDVVGDDLEPVAELRAADATDWIGGVRVAEIRDLPPGVVAIRVSASGDGNPQVARVVRVRLEGTVGITVALTRDCRAVSCEDAALSGCLNGVCVDPACTGENPTACEAAACDSDAGCTTESSCATARCVAGACLVTGDDSLCPLGEVCDPDRGCAARSRGPAPSLVAATLLPIGVEGEVNDAVGDASGDLYVVGRIHACNGETDLGGGPLPQEDEFHAYLASYDAAYAHRWSVVFGGPGDTRLGRGNVANGVTVDDTNGVVYVVGHIRDGVDFGGGVAPDVGSISPFVASYDLDGAFRWARRFRAIGDGTALDVVTDESVVYVVGKYRMGLDLDTEMLPAILGDEGYVLGLTPDGDTIWSRAFAQLGEQQASAAFADGAGGVIVTGHFQRDLDLGGGVIASRGDIELFAAGYGPDGSYRFGLSYPADGGSMNTVRRTASGNVFGAGSLRDSARVDSFSLQSRGGTDGVMFSAAETGDAAWARSFGMRSSDAVFASARDASGNLIVGGEFEQVADFGIGLIYSVALDDGFVASYADDGTPQWALAIGGSRNSDIRALVVGPAGELHALGVYTGTLSVGGEEIGTGVRQLAILRLD